MTNLKSLFGASLWITASALLLLATFEPVPKGRPGAQSGPAIAAQQAAPAASAKL